jgi:hypothetical protein
MDEEQIPDADGVRRFRRPPLDRTGPLRSAAGFVKASRPFTQPASGASPDAGAGAGAGAGPDGEDLGVSMGYEVIDEYLRRAKATAGRHSPDGAPSDGASFESLAGDLERLAEDSIGYYRNLVDTWLRIVTVMGRQLTSAVGASGASPFGAPTGAPAGASGPRPRPGPGSDPAPSPAPDGWQPDDLRAPAAPSAVAVRIVSGRPAVVTLDLKGDADPERLVVQPLRLPEGDVPPITGAAFESDGERARLHVEVPDDQPPGVYVGAVVDRLTGAPAGTLCVELEAPR